MSCNHVCSGNCRHVGCKCECPGEFHEEEEPFTGYTWQNIKDDRISAMNEYRYRKHLRALSEPSCSTINDTSK